MGTVFKNELERTEQQVLGALNSISSSGSTVPCSAGSSPGPAAIVSHLFFGQDSKQGKNLGWNLPLIDCGLSAKAGCDCPGERA